MQQKGNTSVLLPSITLLSLSLAIKCLQTARVTLCKNISWQDQSPYWYKTRDYLGMTILLRNEDYDRF